MASAVTPGGRRPGPSAGPRPGYRQLLRAPGAWRFLLPGFVARQPFAMLTLSIVLLVEHTSGSYGTAGAVAAATGVSMALAAPQNGRLADRFGQTAVLLPGVLVHVLAAGLLTVLALSDAPTWALVAAAVPTGASVPQVSPMVRARWAARLEGSPLLPTAAAFESVTDEFTFVIGPVLATALCAGVHPAAGLVTEAALTLVGGLLFAAQRGTAPPAHRASTGRAGRTPALAVPGVRVLVGAFLGVGTVFGGMQVSLTAFTEEIGRPGLNGALYGVFAAGNVLASLACGAVAWRSSPQRRLLAGYAGLALACVPLWAVDSALLLGGLGLLVGLSVAPVLITGYTLVNALAPATARTESIAWLAGAIALGQAAAAAVAGRLADAFGPGAGFTVPLAGTGLALLGVVALRGLLVPRPQARIAARGVDHRSAVAVD